MNDVKLIGHLGQDPILSHSPQGAPICRFSIATSDFGRADPKTGERPQYTQWHRVVGFGRTAEIAAQYLTKGMQTAVHGRIQYSRYIDGDGITRYSTDIVILRLELLNNGRAASNGAEQQAEPVPETEVSPEAFGEADSESGGDEASTTQEAKGPAEEDDLPF